MPFVYKCLHCNKDTYGSRSFSAAMKEESRQNQPLPTEDNCWRTVLVVVNFSDQTKSFVEAQAGLCREAQNSLTVS